MTNIDITEAMRLAHETATKMLYLPVDTLILYQKFLNDALNYKIEQEKHNEV